MRGMGRRIETGNGGFLLTNSSSEAEIRVVNVRRGKISRADGCRKENMLRLAGYERILINVWVTLIFGVMIQDQMI